MKTTVQCSGCGKGLSVPASLVGKQAKCPACGATVTLAARDGSPSALLGALLDEEIKSAPALPASTAAPRPLAEVKPPQPRRAPGGSFFATHKLVLLGLVSSALWLAAAVIFSLGPLQVIASALNIGVSLGAWRSQDWAGRADREARNWYWLENCIGNIWLVLWSLVALAPFAVAAFLVVVGIFQRGTAGIHVERLALFCLTEAVAVVVIVAVAVGFKALYDRFGFFKVATYSAVFCSVVLPLVALLMLNSVEGSARTRLAAMMKQASGVPDRPPPTPPPPPLRTIPPAQPGRVEPLDSAARSQPRPRPAPSVVPAPPRSGFGIVPGDFARPSSSRPEYVPTNFWPDRMASYLRSGENFKGRALLFAEWLTGDDQRLLEAMKWSSTLRRPQLNMHFGLAMEVNGGVGSTASAPANLVPDSSGPAPRGDSPSQLSIGSDMKRLTGDVSAWLVEGIQQRVFRGDCGEWLSSVARSPLFLRGLTLIAHGDQPQLLADARARQIDGLITIVVRARLVRGQWQASRVMLRIHDPSSEKPLWESNSLTEAQRRAGLPDGRDPAAVMVEEALAYIDQNLRLKELPAITAEQVRKRVSRLTESKPEVPLRTLAELRYYQAKQLITPDEAEAAYVKILGAENGPKLVDGKPHVRRQALGDLVSD